VKDSDFAIPINLKRQFYNSKTRQLVNLEQITEILNEESKISPIEKKCRKRFLNEFLDL
jgi:hypothetical protein